MSNNDPKCLSELIKAPGSRLDELASEARSRIDLADRLRESLPPELSPHLLAANLREDGTLIVVASSPAWASRFRFEATELLAICRKQDNGAMRVRVRVGNAGPGTSA